MFISELINGKWVTAVNNTKSIHDCHSAVGYLTTSNQIQQ